MENLNDGADELKKIKELLDEGIITQKEFEKKKKQLLKTKKKVTPLKVIGIILMVPTTLLAILMVTIFVLAFSDTETSYQQNSNKLTEKEQFAVDYLVTFSEFMKNPHSIELYKVWVYRDKLGYYVAYDLSATNKVGGRVESTYGNSLPLKDTSKASISDAFSSELLLGGECYWGNVFLTAEMQGELLDVDKIQKAFEKEI